MGAIKKLSAVRGTVFDLSYLSSLPDNDCNVLLVSSRTLFLIQSLGRGEVGWPTRYAEQVLDDGLYVTAASDEDLEQIAILSSNYKLEAINMTCNLVGVLQEIVSEIRALSQSSCCGTLGEGSDIGVAEQGGSVPGNIGGIVFEEPAAIDERKCKAANSINEVLTGVFSNLAAYPVEDWVLFTLVLVVSIVTAIFGLLAAPLVALIVGVAGSLAVFCAKLIISGVDIAGMAAIMESAGQQLTCSLYYSYTTDEARDAYLAVLGSEGMSATELELVELLMTNALLAVLFFDTPETATYLETYESQYDCASCAVEFPFFLEYGTGTIRYDGVEFTLSSVPISYYHILQFQLINSPCPTGNWCVEFTATTIETGLSASWTREFFVYYSASCNAVTTNFADEFCPLNTPVLLGGTALANPNPFTVTVKIRPIFRGLGDPSGPFSGNNDCV